MRILIVDDDRINRRVLARTLEKWGHDVRQAEDGEEAWGLLQQERFSFVISDWMMPRMTGPELCKRIREAGFSWYVYVILLTAIDDKAALVEGMDAGADDFVVKPFNEPELRVRIRAGERVLRLERDLEERNTSLAEAYDAARKDIEAAGVMQKSLLPTTQRSIDGLRCSWMFFPCSGVAGDIFNYFQLDEHRVGFYLLDVAGHGVASAMLSFTLSKTLEPSVHRGGIIKRTTPEPPHYEILSPVAVMQQLNERFQDDSDSMKYFTMIYGVVDLEHDRLRLAQAGHPSPVHVNADGVHLIGDSGFPVGVIPDADYEEEELPFRSGDRLFVYSDGVTECRNRSLEQFQPERLVRHLETRSEDPLEELVSELELALRSWNGSDEFDDDVSLLAIERA